MLAAPRCGLELGVAPGIRKETRESIGVQFRAPEDFQIWVRKKRVDFLEVYSGIGSMTAAVTCAGLIAAEGLDSRVIAYNRYWDLTDEGTVNDFA